MCIKTINIDTYPDGTQRVWEKVDSCRPGSSFLCPHPRVQEVRRLLPHKMHVVDVERSPEFLRLPPSPRPSESGSPSGSEGRRRREREAGIYINGAKVADLGPRDPVHRHSSPHRSRPVDVHQRPPPFVPEPPSPRLRRSNTMGRPDFVVIEERQPRLGANVSRRLNRDIPPPPPQVTLTRRASMAAPAPLPRRPLDPAPFIVVDDERRRRRVPERIPAVSTTPAPMPTRPVVRDAVHPSAAAAAVRKELRWEDEQRAAQNARIAMRPKLHQEVRGILKKPPTPPATPTIDPAARERRMAALRRSFSGLEVGEATPEMARRLARAEAREEEEMKDRLRARFVRAGEPEGERRRGSRVYYPGEGLYKYMG